MLVNRWNKLRERLHGNLEQAELYHTLNQEINQFNIRSAYKWNINEELLTDYMFRNCNISQVNIPEFPFQHMYDVAGLEFEFDFEEERKTNVAKIAYDKSIVSSEELITVVSKLNEGQFLVGTVSFEDMTIPSKATNSSTSKSTEQPKVEVSSSYVKLPNLFDLFSGLLR